MSINNFIPVIWSARVTLALEKSHVYGQPGVINRDYEGEITEAGDTVYINSIGDPTIFNYTKNTDMPVPETLSDARVTLLIDQAKGFNFQVDDVDRAQTRPDVMDPAMQRAAYKLADIADLYVGTKMAAGALAGNNLGSDGTPIVPTLGSFTDPLNIYNVLVDASTKLNQSNVPRDNRFAIIPPWVEGLLRKDERFVPDDTVRLNGVIGRAAGFNILVSNNVPTVAGPPIKYKIIYGHSMAMTFAEQISKTEAYRPERRFGDAVKGLNLYGGGVTEPAALGVATMSQT
jgi:P22 coat protein - gene protein 5